MADDIKLNIGIDADSAKKSIDKFIKDTTQTLNQAQKSFKDSANSLKLDIGVETSTAKKAVNSFVDETTKTLNNTKKSFETAADGTKFYKDAIGRLRAENGKFISSAKATELGIKDVGDQTDETSESVDDLKKGLNGLGNQKGVQKFGSNVKTSLKTTEKSLLSFKNLAIAAVGIFAGRALIGGIKSVTEAASIQQDAVNNLNTALRTSGEFSQAASQDFQDFAAAIEETTKFGDEAVLQALALAKAFGATNDQAKLITEASIELAAATGKSLDEATRQVSKTIGGFAGELGELNPEIKALTSEQLKAGGAAKVLLDQYNTSAASQIKTYSGATTQLGNAYGTLQESIGSIITNNPQLIASLNSLRAIFSQLATVISDNSGTLGSLLSTVISFAVDGIGLLVKSLGGLNEVIRSVVFIAAFLNKAIIDLIKTFVGVSFVQDIINGVQDAFIDLATAAVAAITAILSAFNSIPGVAGKFDSTIASIETSFIGLLETVPKSSAAGKLEDFLGGLSDAIPLDAINDGFDSVSENIAKVANFTDDLSIAINNASNDSVDNLKNSVKGVGDAVSDAADTVKKELSPALTALQDENAKLALDIAKVGKNQTEQAKLQLEFEIAKIDRQIASLDLTKEENKLIKEQLDLKKANVTTLASSGSSTSGGGTGSKASQEQAGQTIAERFVTVASIGYERISEFFSQTVGGGLVNTFTGIIDSFSSIPQTFITAFEKLDTVALSLAENFGSAFLKVVERLPEFFAKAVESLGQIGRVLIDALPSLVSSLADGIVDLAILLADSLIPQFIKKIPAIIQGIIKSLPRLITALARSLGPIVRELARAIPELVKVLADNISPIVIALVQGITEAIPDIIIALVDELIVKGGIFRIAAALAKALLIDLPIALAQGFIRGIANIGSGVFKGLGAAFSTGITLPKLDIPRPAFIDELSRLFDEPPFLQKLRDIFDSFNPSKAGGGNNILGNAVKSLESIPVIGSVVGAASNAISSVGRSLGFAEGGTIPAGFNNDTFPARLSSGEEVVNRETSEKLRDFLDGNGSNSQNVFIELKVGEQKLADVMYNLNRRGFRTA